MLNEFREFAIKGNVVDMAVGIIIGAAFTSVVNSVVDDIMTPVIGALAGDLDFGDRFWVIESGDPAGPYVSVVDATEAGAVVVAYGRLVNQIVSFIIVALALFLLIRWVNRLRRTDTDAAPTTKTCRFCKSHIDVDASRCSHCTAELAEA